MAKKQKKTEVKRLPTKQQLSKWERQKKIQRIILISGCIVFALVIALAGYGYYDQKVKPFQQKVLKVDDRIFDMNYYLDALDIFLSDIDAARAPMMADMVIGTIARNQLILDRAPSLGVTISDAEVESELRKQQVPVTQLTRDIFGAEVLSSRLLSVYFDTKVPQIGRQANIQAMFVESLEVAEDVLKKLNENESFIQLAKRFSVEDFTKGRSGEVGWITYGLETLSQGKFKDSLLDDIAFSTTPGTMSKPTYDSSITKKGGYWLLKVIEKNGNVSSRMSGILLSSEVEAIEVRSKLAGGADFAELAKEKSQHLESKDSGGDLGPVQKGYANEVVVKAAFELPLNTLSNPLQDTSVLTKGGYWLVKTLERDENRQLDKETRDQLKMQAFQIWIDEQAKTSTIEQYLTQKDKDWAITRTLEKQEKKTNR